MAKDKKRMRRNAYIRAAEELEEMAARRRHNQKPGRKGLAKLLNGFARILRLLAR